MFSQVTRKKVAMVMAKPMKPKRVLTKASGEVSEVLEMVTPMVIEGKGRAGQGVNGGRCLCRE